MLTVAGVLLVLAGVAAFFSNGSIALTATAKADGVQASRFETGRIIYKVAGVLSAVYGVYVIVQSII